MRIRMEAPKITVDGETFYGQAEWAEVLLPHQRSVDSWMLKLTPKHPRNDLHLRFIHLCSADEPARVRLQGAEGGFTGEVTVLRVVEPLGTVYCTGLSPLQIG